MQVADPFHVVRLAASKLDEVRRRNPSRRRSGLLQGFRRRIQQETLGHRGRKTDPLYRARKLLVLAQESLQDRGRTKLAGLLKAGDPQGHVATAWHAKEAVRQTYAHDDAELARDWLDQLATDLQDLSCPPEIRQLGRTLRRWSTQIVAWHTARVSNGPTESMNNLIKRIKRVAFGMTNFRNWRIRVLLYAGRPDWSRLAAVTP